MASDAVVRDGLRALGRTRSVVAGKLNSAFAWFGQHFPALAAAMFGTMMSKALTPESIAGIGASGDACPPWQPRLGGQIPEP
ncbi:MAG: hypothetical protein HRU17_15960 [Polyangiaceae bacterium]|nr:hypothetical protein [Polyangiaceae bacterium]